MATVDAELKPGEDGDAERLTRRSEDGVPIDAVVVGHRDHRDPRLGMRTHESLSEGCIWRSAADVAVPLLVIRGRVDLQVAEIETRVAQRLRPRLRLSGFRCPP